MRIFLRTCLALSWGLAAAACSRTPASVPATDPASPLHLERKIPLPDVRGRIDHLAINTAGQRLFVAEIANGTVDEVDLSTGKVVGRIGGLHEPQGLEFVAAQRELVVASGDGTVRFFSADRRPLAQISLGADADDVRIDPRNGHVLVGYGAGGIATIDPVTHHLLARLTLAGHPEGFQLVGSRLLVNIPDRGAIVAADLDNGTVQAVWPTGLHRLNFPMTVAPHGDRILVAYRLPAALAALRIADGGVIFLKPTCGDSDDLYADASRVFVICGAGHVDVQRQDTGATLARVTTAPGACTGLMAQRKLYVAAPARNGPAAIWVLRIGL